MFFLFVCVSTKAIEGVRQKWIKRRQKVCSLLPIGSRMHARNEALLFDCWQKTSAFPLNVDFSRSAQIVIVGGFFLNLIKRKI